MRAHGWTREFKNRQQTEALHPEIDPNFLFANTGFNLRPTEINAVLGLIQLKKLNGFNHRRNEIASIWTNRFLPRIEQGTFYPMQPTARAGPASFGYPVICRDPQIRKALNHHLIH